MKRIQKIALLIIIVGCGTGCTTGYWKDRGRDALDIASIGYGVGLGAKVKVGLGIGLLADIRHTGLRGGEFIHNERSYLDVLTFNVDKKASEKVDVEAHFLLFGVADFQATQLERGKNYSYQYFSSWSKEEQKSPPMYTQVEVCVGLGPSVNIGFNPGELLDFLLGWFSVDIYNDDLERRKKREIEQAVAGSGEPNP